MTYSSRMFTVEPEDTLEPEQRLWRAVLGQMFDDAFGPDTYLKTKLDRKIALDFLKDMENNSHLSFICESAGFDIGYVKRKVRKQFIKQMFGKERCLHVG